MYGSFASLGLAFGSSLRGPRNAGCQRVGCALVRTLVSASCTSSSAAEITPNASRDTVTTADNEQALPTADVQEQGPQPQGPARLTSADLQAALARQGLRAAVVPEVSAEALPPAVAIVKSIVLVADGSPLLAVVRGEERVDERKVADLLGVARRRVRLASTDEVLRFTGFAVGTVPPVGHPRSLRTLIDVAVTRLSVVYGGGGDPDMELRLAVPDLLHYTAATVAHVSDAPEPASEAALGAAQGASAGLPLPWPGGSEFVSLVGVVAQRRRIARLLQFANLVPEAVPGLPPDVTAVYLRRLWRNPETGAPVEVQLIMGKTLERNLGREQAQALLDQVKVGCVVAITGKVQPHTASSPSANAPGEGDPGPSAAATGPPARQQQRSDVLDVVCHSVTVLHKSRDHLNKALRAAKRAGLGSPSSALELMRLQQQAGNPEHPEASTPWSDRVVFGASADTSDAGDTSDDSAGEAFAPTGLQCDMLDTAAAGDTRRGGGPPATAPAVATEAAAVASAEPVPDGWRMPLPVSAIRMVSTAAEVGQMHREVLGDAWPAPSATDVNATDAAAEVGCGDSGRLATAEEEARAAAANVVGLDCEWEPYDRHQTKTPVSILQVATRRAVYIIDLLRLMSTATPGAALPGPHGEPTAAGPTGAATASTILPKGAAALSRFLSALMASGRIVKLGFQLASDLDRLCDSYPELPCFSEQGVPYRAAHAPAPATNSSSAAAASASGSGGAQEDCGPDTTADPRVCRLCFDVVDVARKLRPGLGRTQQMSLSRIVAMVLGTPLDKTQQRSAWGRRPLSPGQLLYAASDAYCLIALYDALLLLGRTRSSTGGDGASLVPEYKCEGEREGESERSAESACGIGNDEQVGVQVDVAAMEQVLSRLATVPTALGRLPLASWRAHRPR